MEIESVDTWSFALELARNRFDTKIDAEGKLLTPPGARTLG